MKTTKIMLALLLLSTLLVFSAWSEGAQEGKAEGVSLRIQVLDWDGMYGPIGESIEEYSAEDPAVRIALEHPGDYWSKIPASFTAGTEGDIVYWMARDFLPYFISGRCKPIPESVMSSKEIEDTYWPGSLTLWKYNGKYYGITDDYNMEGWTQLYINRSLLKQYGHDVPSGWIEKGMPDSFQEILSFAKEITLMKGDRVAIPGFVGANDKWNAYRFVSLLFQAGGDYRDEANGTVHFDTPEGKKALEFMANILLKEKVDSFELGDGITQFIENGMAFMANGAPHWEGKFKGAHPDSELVKLGFPAVFGDKPYWYVDGGWGYAVSCNCQEVEEAWSFVKFATDYERQKRIALSAGYIPTRKEMAKDRDIQKVYGSVLDILPYGVGSPFYVIGLGDMIAEGNIIDQEIEAVYLGNKSVDQALADMESRVNAMIQEKQKSL